ncbi:hypothetical protein MJA45_00595 [Paenibacillus aurantius]|uniref:Uncharacterized protein n=1 Tax=Paenibacillus aurantius TaxID=2918900 RepID=A0AA96LGL8_9BACL|nr:hypothetical protein [Paenibacillus aurantius]WNQ11611.1 hypothetical protein MJA45_00595 [Paenibacillus aurantius]
MHSPVGRPEAANESGGDLRWAADQTSPEFARIRQEWRIAEARVRERLEPMIRNPSRLSPGRYQRLGGSRGAGQEDAGGISRSRGMPFFVRREEKSGRPNAGRGKVPSSMTGLTDSSAFASTRLRKTAFFFYRSKGEFRHKWRSRKGRPKI